MFTGIVAAVGQIERIEPQQGADNQAGVRLQVRTPSGFLHAGVRLGDSIAIQGACMTVVAMEGDCFTVDVSRESLNCTVGLDKPAEVNLEHALRLGDSLDGHLVSGHVDGVGLVQRFEPIGESWDLLVRVPAALAHYMAPKGSVTVNGVSLTINEVHDHAEGCDIRINLIPHTVQVTTLKHLAAGTPVNLEADMMARYVDRILAYRGR